MTKTEEMWKRIESDGISFEDRFSEPIWSYVKEYMPDADSELVIQEIKEVVNEMFSDLIAQERREAVTEFVEWVNDCIDEEGLGDPLDKRCIDNFLNYKERQK